MKTTNNIWKYREYNQLVSDGTYLYTVLGLYETGPTTANYEIIIPKITISTGALKSQMELKSPSIPTELALTYYSASSYLFVCMAFTTRFELIRITTTSTAYSLLAKTLYFTYSA